MILKVNRNSDHVRKHDDDLNQWLYVDKIKSFSTRTFIPHKEYRSHTIKDDQSNPEDVICEYLEINYSHVILDPGRLTTANMLPEKLNEALKNWYDDYATEFIIYDEDGDKSTRMSIVFNTYAYLMNDQGQTIEKFTH